MNTGKSLLLLFAAFALGMATNLGKLPLLESTNVEAQNATPGPTAAVDRQIVNRTTVLHEAGDVLARVSELTTPSVVHIQSARNIPNSGRVEETGSGVIVRSKSKSGLFVVTNRHVVEGADPAAIDVQLHDGRVIQPMMVLADEKSDVAVMQLQETNLQAAQWGDSDAVKIGHFVLAMGSPFGLSQSVTLGIISAKGRRSLKLGATNDVINQDFLQTDAAINPGNSGGPLIDLQGRIIGINTAIASSSGGNEGIGFSIPSNLVRFVVEGLIANGEVQRAYLGVKLDPNFTQATARRLSLDRARGARVVEVYADTPAARAQLRKDDVVLQFNGTVVQDESHLINLVSLTPVESRVRMLVMRNGRQIQLTVVLADRSDLESRAAAPRFRSSTPSGRSFQSN